MPDNSTSGERKAPKNTDFYAQLPDIEQETQAFNYELLITNWS